MYVCSNMSWDLVGSLPPPRKHEVWSRTNMIVSGFFACLLELAGLAMVELVRSSVPLSTSINQHGVGAAAHARSPTLHCGVGWMARRWGGGMTVWY